MLAPIFFGSSRDKLKIATFQDRKERAESE
jgi:hypothetical protein